MITMSSPRVGSRHWPSLVAAAAALLLSLPASSLSPVRVDAEVSSSDTPLPAGWVLSRSAGMSQRPVLLATQEPLWGVPAFEPPSAAHCKGPARLREWPGAQVPMQPSTAHSRSSWWDAAKRAEGAVMAARPAPSALPPSPVPSTSPSPANAEAGRVAQGAAATSAQAVRPGEVVSAGMVDDNADFGEYQAFRRRSAHLSPRDRDSSERYRVSVRDLAGQPVADAEVALSWPGARESLRFARTDGAGQVWLLPRMLLSPEVNVQLQGVRTLEVQARAPSGEVVRSSLQRGQKSAVELTLKQRLDAPSQVPLDLVFLVDATGSMGDEIDKLRASLRSIASRVGALPARPDMCWGLVAYRDLGDAFVTRTHDLTNDLGAFQQSLVKLQAAGGGDYPEALNEALDEVVHRVSWRGAGTSRLVVLVADAPPHLDRGGPFYDQAAAVALAKGIKLHAVGASGLDGQGEVVFRQLAQSTGGRFVFLTYREAQRPDSGPGRETVHDVRDYSVDTLDELIVRLVADELTQRTRRPG